MIFYIDPPAGFRLGSAHFHAKSWAKYDAIKAREVQRDELTWKQIDLDDGGWIAFHPPSQPRETSND